MRQELIEFFGPREEEVLLGGEKVIVRTLPDDADKEGFKKSEVGNGLWLFIVRCTFYPDGRPAFTDDDIPLLKAAPRIRTLRLIQAVENVNGFNAYEEVKNSAAAPSAG